MRRHVFLSFLGTGNYEPLQYFLPGMEPGVAEKFVQKSILDQIKPVFNENSRAFIFLTPQARTINWEAEKEGLKDRLEKMNYPFAIQEVDISGGSGNEEIWNTFQAVFNCLKEEDYVYLDITHSWRYLPMLTMALLNYAKILKNIQVQAIYYGAMEQLGPLQKIRQLPMNERPAPVYDLSAFSKIQDWTVAADDFIRYGNAERWVSMANEQINPVLAETKGQDANASTLRDIGKALSKQLLPQLRNNQGAELLDSAKKAIPNLLNRLDEYQSETGSLGGALQPILNKLKEKVAYFRGAEDLIWLKSARWCLEHDMVQQGITQLQEGCITWLCMYFEEKLRDPYFNWKSEHPRGLLSSIMQKYDLEESEWKGELGEKKPLVRRIKEDHYLKAAAKKFSELSDLRNKINHGGYTKSSKSKTFRDVLKSTIEKFESIFTIANAKEAARGGILVNFSNHPSNRWLENQLEAAREQYDEVKDLPFPSIDPQVNGEGLRKEVDIYLQKIMDLQPRAVHIMGEMTFTFAMVRALQQAGIPCMASTTRRIVHEEQDGVKRSEFQFVGYRLYERD